MISDDRTPPIDIGDLQRQLAAAMEAHGEASQEESAARSRLTDAINRVNAIQKALDEAMEKLRGKAPWNTDWHSKRNQSRAVTG